MLGVLNPKGAMAEDKIKALEVQADHWKAERGKAEDGSGTTKSRSSSKEVERVRSEITKLESLEKTARLQADFERLKK